MCNSKGDVVCFSRDEKKTMTKELVRIFVLCIFFFFLGGVEAFIDWDFC